jgi:hypothetical protein
MSVKQPEVSNDDFEQHLTRALRPVDPPAGFADRILAQAQSPKAAPAEVIVMRPRTRLWASGAIAAALFVGSFFAQQAHQRHQREQAALAQQQFEVAMRITDETLEQTRQQLQQAGLQIGK